MKINYNGIIREMTEEEILAHQELESELQKEYWSSISYGEAVDAEIRKKYSISEEFAILRQKDEKIEEYTEYYVYCESCKIYVKEMKEKYNSIK